MSAQTLKTIECVDLPKCPDPNTVYRLLPKNPDADYYRERTNRNLGWITPEEQEILHRSVLYVGGCGGMGGALAATFVRAGIGEVRIGDSEDFEVSNTNRQFAAGRYTLGKSKAFETARMIRAITDDSMLVVYPQGITEETAATSVEGCDIVLDEIEFWAVGSRLLLHQAARKAGVPLLNCNTVGFGTRLFLFEPDGYTMEDLLGFSYEEAKTLQERVQTKTASPEEVQLMMRRVLTGLVPELPEYSTYPGTYSTVEAALRRLLEENRATIIATNPAMAAGFLADHTLFQLLKNSPVRRNYVLPPPAPGYLYFDAGFLCAKRVERTEVLHE